MQLSIDKHTNAVTNWRGSNVSSAKGKRYGRFPVLVRFTDDGVVQDLGRGALGLLGIKLEGAEDYLAVAHPWIKSGSGNRTFYIFDLNLRTPEVSACFGGGVKSVSARLEIRYQYGSVDDRSVTINFDIADALNNGEAPPPVSGQPAWPLPSVLLAAIEAISEINANYLPGAIYSAEVEEGDYFVDIAIPDSVTKISSLGLQKPSAELDDFSVLNVCRLSPTTVRAALSGATTAPGYIATILCSR